MLKVTIEGFDDLSDIEKQYAPTNGHGKELANYIRVTENDKTVFFVSDAMEPEDCCFTRDLVWVKDAIEYAYQVGQSEARAKG